MSPVLERSKCIPGARRFENKMAPFDDVPPRPRPLRVGKCGCGCVCARVCVCAFVCGFKGKRERKERQVILEPRDKLYLELYLAVLNLVLTQ